MALPNYGVLCGTVIAKLDSLAAMKKNPRGSPHFEINVLANGQHFRVAVNVKSDQQPPNLQFFFDEHYQHPITDKVIKFAPGFTLLKHTAAAGAIDFLRGNLFDIHKMRVVPAILPGENNDLNDSFNSQVKKALEAPGSLLFAFGSRWGPEKNRKDDYFDFLPGNGIHDIHMNQGNIGAHAKDNGVYQDGALFIHFPAEKRWLAMFLKFQSQVITTVDSGVDAGSPTEDR